MSKVRKMRAIHNPGVVDGVEAQAVVTMSKVRKMRAIHNADVLHLFDKLLL